MAAVKQNVPYPAAQIELSISLSRPDAHIRDAANSHMGEEGVDLDALLLRVARPKSFGQAEQSREREKKDQNASQIFTLPPVLSTVS